MVVLAVLLGMSSAAAAQGTGEVWGKVIDRKTRTTLPGVSVFIKYGATVIGVNTDADGAFRIKSIPPGTHTVHFSFVGYGEGSIEQVNVFADGIVRLGDFAMEAGVDITGATVYADPVIGTDAYPKVVQKDLDHMAGNQNLVKVISSITSDVQSTDDGQLYFRGARDDDFVYYVDGVKLKGDVKIPSTAVGSIQVYTGGVPARYGDFTGGCVVIETQSYFNWLNSRMN